jgi:hypothetical protein
MLQANRVTTYSAEQTLRRALHLSGLFSRENLVDDLIALHGLLAGYVSLSGELLIVRHAAHGVSPRAGEA